MTISNSVSGQPSWQQTPQAGLQVNSVAVSPDGQLTVGGTSSEFGSGQFNFYGYDATGSQLWSVPVTAANVTQGIFWVAVSDDKRFAACGGETSKTCGFLCILDASTGTILFQDNNLPARVNQLSFSSDGTLLLADFQHELRLYHYAHGHHCGAGSGHKVTAWRFADRLFQLQRSAGTKWQPGLGRCD